MIDRIITRLEGNQAVGREDLCALLSITSPAEEQELYRRAYLAKKKEVGAMVYFRGIIEVSNRCTKDCYYCGIRRSNPDFERYELSEEEIVSDAMWAHKQRYGSVVLQAGERKDRPFLEKIVRVLKQIKKKSNGELGITLSLGEQDESTYQRWFDAGAHRYLLRIETSNEDLYKRLHPPDHSFLERLSALEALRTTGYQVGTGVLIGLPGQTIEDLAGDILFFREMDVDMIGMGPYVLHHQTPLAEEVRDMDPKAGFDLALKMIAVTRLFLKDVNIAATTALQALHPTGRELGIQAGANVIMPNITNARYRKYYQLYEGKPSLEEDPDASQSVLQRRIEGMGETIGFGQWGDSLRFSRRKSATAALK